MTKSRKLAYLALFSATFIWGIAPPIIKYTLQFISPISFLFYRFLVASFVVAIPTILRVRKIRPTKEELIDYLFLGFLCTPLNLLLLFLGIQKTTAVDASLISITSPFLVAVGGGLFLKENITKKEGMGIGIAMAGTLLTIIQPLLENGFGLQNVEGNLLVFLGTLVWVVFTLLAKKKHHLDPVLLSSFSFLVGLITFIPLVILTPTVPSSLDTYFLILNTNTLPGILFMAIFSSVIAYSTHFYGLSKIEASEAVVFTYLQPIFSVPLASILLKEKITLPFILGALLIATGVAFSAFDRHRRNS